MQYCAGFFFKYKNNQIFWKALQAGESVSGNFSPPSFPPSPSLINMMNDPLAQGQNVAS